MDKYRVTSDVTGNHEFVIASTTPTICPSGDAIKAGSEVICETGVLINDGTAKELILADYKQLRYNEIDGKTMAIIGAGFLYDGQTFSLSLPAQKNWDAIKTSKNDFTFPLDIGTIDNNTYSLATGNVNAFWIEGRDAVKAPLDSGRILKTSVFSAVDEAAVDAVVDLR